MKNKRTKEEFEMAIKNSFSIAEVCRKLNIKPVGGNYKGIHKAIEEYGFDVSHFTGQGWNNNLHYQPHPPKPLNEILTQNSYYQTFKLKKRLLNSGIKERKCECCGLTEWNNKPIPLELHHINGINNDNRIDNLQIICPNCHAQTDNYRGLKLRDTKKNL